MNKRRKWSDRYPQLQEKDQILAKKIKIKATHIIKTACKQNPNEKRRRRRGQIENHTSKRSQITHFSATKTFSTKAASITEQSILSKATPSSLQKLPTSISTTNIVATQKILRSKNKKTKQKKKNAHKEAERGNPKPYAFFIVKNKTLISWRTKP